MRKPRWPLGAVLAIVAALVTVGGPTPAPAAESPRVLMVDNEPDLTRWHYEPADITVPAGTTVVWFNKGKEEHSVTADDKSFDSGLKKTGGTFSRAFARPGKYAYYCAPHPWMKGTVEVVAAAPTPRTAAAAPPATAPTSAAAAVDGTASSTTTFPSSLAAPTTAPADTATTVPAETTSTSPAEEGSEETSAAPAASKKRSGGHLAGTLAVVLLPTLGGLALGARLRRKES